MALIFILHVIAIGILLHRLPLRLWTFLGAFVYFAAFYLVCGHFIAGHRQLITPQMPLEDDYYRYQRTQKKSPFDRPDYDVNQKDDEEATLELERKARQEKQKLEEAQPKTKP